MFNRPRQNKRGWENAWAFHAILILGAFGSSAFAQARGDGDMPLPLADSLREAGIVPGTPAPTTTPAVAAKPVAVPVADDLPPLPADMPTTAPAPAPVVAPAPVAASAPVAAPAPAPVRAPAADIELELPPLPSDQPARAPVAETAAEPAPAPAPAVAPAPAATPAPIATPVPPSPSVPAASAAVETAHEGSASANHSQMFSAPLDESFTQASCASCGNRVRADLNGFGKCNSCGRAGQCVPGRKGCGGMSGCSEHFGCRLLGNLYECLCCPDPCYQPSWIPEANAAFFQDYARPRSLTRFRWDHGWQMRYPDRNEFFWARQATSGGGGRGPAFPPKGYTTAKNGYGQSGVNFDQLYFYTEAASAVGSAFFEMPYRSNNPALGGSMSGFADLNFGTKSLLFDTELLQLTFQFKTFMPTGQTGKGLGTGHVSLEPSLLMAMRLGPETYIQGQFAEWIPLGGDPTYAGALMHYHLSFNQVLWRPMPDTPIIGTFEFNGWSFQDGAYTSPSFAAPQNSGGNSYLNLGTGLRASVCDKIDFGGAVAFPLTDNYWANPLLRFELRILY